MSSTEEQPQVTEESLKVVDDKGPAIDESVKESEPELNLDEVSEYDPNKFNMGSATDSELTPEEEEKLAKLEKEVSDEESKESEEGGEEDTKETSEEDESKEESEESSSLKGLLEVKINGEIQKVSLEDLEKNHPEVLQNLKNEVSGVKEVQRRFSELDKEKKEFYTEKREIEGLVSQYRDILNQGDIAGAVSFLGELGGIPSYQMKAQLLQWAMPEIEQRMNLNQDQLEALQAREELEYLRSKQESKTKRVEAEQSEQELLNHINSVRETHKITDEEWDTALSKAMDVKPEDLGVDDVVEQVQELRMGAKTSEVIKEFDDFPDQLTPALQKVIKDNPDFDHQTLIEIVKEAMAKSGLSKPDQDKKDPEKELGKKLPKRFKQKTHSKEESEDWLEQVKPFQEKKLY